jgi:hypothetical protein
MTDTIKIPRPKFPRTQNAGGRVEHDQRGNAVWRRSRASDSVELQVPADLALLDEPTGAAGKARGQVPTAPKKP